MKADRQRYHASMAGHWMVQTLDDKNPLPEDRAAIHRWLDTFAAAVRARDYGTARGLCAVDVFSFGTVVARALGIDDLESGQWRPVWSVTSGFSFDLSLMHCGGSGGTFWVAAPWSSWGYRQQEAFERRGRATVVLRQFGPSLRAVHTHFSLRPEARIETARRQFQNAEGSAS
jgi:ketosteroid isomerase-like protein